MSSVGEERKESLPIAILSTADVGSIWLNAGFSRNLADEARVVADLTAERIIREISRSSSDLEKPLRFGAFSYLLESLRNLGIGEAETDASVRLASEFLRRNEDGLEHSTEDFHLLLDTEVFVRFAEIMTQGKYDWDSFCVDFLDPEAAFINRIRQNLELSPTERWKRHENLRRQMDRVRSAG